MPEYSPLSMLRYLPAVDEVLKTEEIRNLLIDIPRPLVLEAIREATDTARVSIKQGNIDWSYGGSGKGSPREILTRLIAADTARLIRRKNRPNLRRVINATGVVLHTNLGRAVLSENARRAIENAAAGYTNLELDLATGKRGSRYAPVEKLLTRLTGAEAALVVNNNAAAVLLALGTMARDREVIVSRGQLVEIGGSFRIPEVMAQSGARLVEVGATNKTYPDDYRRAVTPDTALLLNVHTSNYRIVGFTRETSVAELAALGNDLGLPVMSDLGSGSLASFNFPGQPDEPTVQDTVKAGADVVTFSGDKLLGGPQAGIIVGRKAILDQMKKNPLTRAIRIDKFTVSALEATLREYLEPELAGRIIPTLAMLWAGQSALEQKAAALRELLHDRAGTEAQFNLIRINSAVGGGAMPTADLPSWGVEVCPSNLSVNELAIKLREDDPAVIGRLQDDKLILDVRTLLPGQENQLAETVARGLRREVDKI